VGDELQAFAWPQQRLIRLLDDLELDHETRDTVGRHLAVLGDPRPGVGVREDGTPDIDWVAIPGGEVELEQGAGKAQVESFHMSRYLVTNAQFQAFVDAHDGYGKSDWWEGVPEDANVSPAKPRWPEPNRPRETVSWYEAVAFCRWISARLGVEVRLPTEYEWQQAATSGH
jgi:formylglycine-generating enzyme required for sulfatase activity